MALTWRVWAADFEDVTMVAFTAFVLGRLTVSVPCTTQENELLGLDSSRPAHQRHEQHHEAQAEVD